ncbi:hypothetical protein [Chroococcidiopsis sp. TS-821]|uniref:hypothetical protein n=1 Tax=Chroococcidiopsis sp. TS-821 TaxID=1378066 RepID=UPI001AEF4C51|nr:hypothetical protein [Chroococcidiopsis sp. TS-821]
MENPNLRASNLESAPQIAQRIAVSLRGNDLRVLHAGDNYTHFDKIASRSTRCYWLL